MREKIRAWAQRLEDLVEAGAEALASLQESYQAVLATSVSGSTGVWVDLPDLTITFTTDLNDQILIKAVITGAPSGSGFMALRLVLDGTPLTTARGHRHVPFVWRVDSLSAGSHTIKIQRGPASNYSIVPGTDGHGGTLTVQRFST